MKRLNFFSTHDFYVRFFSDISYIKLCQNMFYHQNKCRHLKKMLPFYVKIKKQYTFLLDGSFFGMHKVTKSNQMSKCHEAITFGICEKTLTRKPTNIQKKQKDSSDWSLWSLVSVWVLCNKPHDVSQSVLINVATQLVGIMF